MPSPLLNVRSGTQDPASSATPGNRGDIFLRTGGSGGTAYLKQDNGTTTNWTPIAFSQAETVIVKDVKTLGTQSGDFNSGSWVTRDLNTVENSKAWLSLAANVVTLDAGTYRVNWSAPAALVSAHQSRLQNTTDATTTSIGTSQYDGTAVAVTTASKGFCIFSIAASKDFEIQHQCAVTRLINGFGVACSFTSEVYTVLEITKLA